MTASAAPDSVASFDIKLKSVFFFSSSMETVSAAAAAAAADEASVLVAETAVGGAAPATFVRPLAVMRLSSCSCILTGEMLSTVVVVVSVVVGPEMTAFAVPTVMGDAVPTTGGGR